MISPSFPVLRPSRTAASILVLLLVGASFGCAPRSAHEVASDRARVLGTWEYRTSGIGILQHGTLQIIVRDAQLVGRMRDSWRGQVHAQVYLHGTRMEIDLDRLRIRGRLERGRFTGSAHRPMWDVSRSTVERQVSEGRFVARRVHQPESPDEASNLGCASLLHESSFACRVLEL